MKTPLPSRFEYPRTTRVIYDRASGEIVHIHHVVILPKAEAPDEEHLDADAVALASRFSKRPGAELLALKVESSEFQADARYRVNPETRKLQQIGEAPR
jgi:hypothetical protein